MAELAGKFKGRILPMPSSNDEVTYLKDSYKNIHYKATCLSTFMHRLQILFTHPPFRLQLPFRRRPPCSLQLQHPKHDNEDTDVSNFVHHIPHIWLLDIYRKSPQNKRGFVRFYCNVIISTQQTVHCCYICNFTCHHQKRRESTVESVTTNAAWQQTRQTQQVPSCT